jgi:hypothetical protein
VEWCNQVAHEAPWTEGDLTTRGGFFIALELAEQAYQAHGLPYETDSPNVYLYGKALVNPRRFTWVYDGSGAAQHCVKVRDDQTSRVALWPWWTP